VDNPVVLLLSTDHGSTTTGSERKETRRKVLICCTLVETLTDAPEIALFIAWGQLETEILFVVVLMFDIVMSLYSMFYTPFAEGTISLPACMKSPPAAREVTAA